MGTDWGDETGPPPGGERVVVQEEVAVSRREAHELDRRAGWAAHNWYWLAAFGGIGVVFGLVVLSRAFGSLSALVWLTGLFLVLVGVAQLATMGIGGDRLARFGGSVIAIVGGIVLLAWPGETLKVLAFVAGVTVLLWGVVRSAAALRGPADTRGHDLVVGGLLVVLGILMMVWPGATVTLLGVLVGLAAVAWGIVTFALALRLRKEGVRWRRLRARSHSARKDA